jgi:hypothetical protein
MSDDPIARAPRGPQACAYLSAKQAAYYLGFSPRHLQRLRSRGDGPPFRRHSRTLCYRLDELVAWSESRRRTKLTV